MREEANKQETSRNRISKYQEEKESRLKWIGSTEDDGQFYFTWDSQARLH